MHERCSRFQEESSARSTSGVLLMFGSTAVQWTCTRQPTVALSSTEAEYVAASEAAREISWFRTYLADVGLAQPASTPLFIDNSTAIRIALEEGNHARRKHINVKHHYVREQATEGYIELKWVPTADQLADFFTKPMPRARFEQLRASIMGKAAGSAEAASG